MKKLKSDVQQNNDFTFIDLLKQNKKLEMYGNKFELIKKNGQDCLTVNGKDTAPFVIDNNKSHIRTDFRDESGKVFIDGMEFKGENSLSIDKDGSIALLLVDREKNIEGTFFGFNKETLESIRVEDDIFYKTKDDKIIEANHYPKYLLAFDWNKLSALNKQLKQNNQDVSDNLSEQFSRFKKIRNALVGYDVPDDNPAFCIDIQCWKIGKDKMLFVEPYFPNGYDSDEEDERAKDKIRFVLWDEKYKEVVTICECDRDVVNHIMADERYIYLQFYDNNKLKTDILSLTDFGIVKTIKKDDKCKTSHINRETLSYYDENNMDNMIKTFVSEQQQKVQAVNKIQRVFRKYKRDKQQNNNNITLNLENKKDQKKKKDDCVIC